MAAFFLSQSAGASAGPGTNVSVTEAGSTNAAASVNLQINTTINPNLSRTEVLRIIQSFYNYVATDNSVLGLTP